MNTKYFFIALISWIFGYAAYGAYTEYKDHQNYIENNECVETSRDDEHTEYNPKFGGSFIIYPTKIHYLCKDGTEYIKWELTK